MPAAAVIPAPIAYIKVAAFKPLVVEACSWVWYLIAVCSKCCYDSMPQGVSEVHHLATAIAIYSLLLLATDWCL